VPRIASVSVSERPGAFSLKELKKTLDFSLQVCYNNIVIKKGDKVMKKMIIILAVVLIIASIIFEVWLMATYGGKPASEIPLWALLFLLGR
jgi:cytosine/uracil/thiamine/allantoin permease